MASGHPISNRRHLLEPLDKSTDIHQELGRISGHSSGWLAVRQVVAIGESILHATAIKKKKKNMRMRAR